MGAGRTIFNSARGKNLRIRAEWRRDAIASLQKIKRQKRRIVRKVLYDCADVFLEKAEANIGARPGPLNRSGRLKASLMKATKKDNSRIVHVVAGPARKIFYAHMVEGGTKPHMQPKRGVMHPGAKPYPFGKPAWDSSRSKIEAKFGRDFWNKIRRVGEGNPIQAVYGKGSL